MRFSLRGLGVVAIAALTVSLTSCAGGQAGNAAGFLAANTTSPSSGTTTTVTVTASAAPSAGAASSSAVTTGPATATGATTFLLDGTPVDRDPRIAVSGTDEENAGLPFDVAFRDAAPVAASEVVNLDQTTGIGQTAVEQALVSTAVRLAAKQQVDYLPVDVEMVPLSLVSNPQTGEIQDGQLPLHIMRQPIVVFSSKQGVVSTTLIELQPLTREDAANFDRLVKQKRPASGLTGASLQEDSLGYTTLVTDGRPDGSATLLRGRTFSAACLPGDAKDCIYVDDNNKEGFGLQGKPLVLIRSTLQRLDFGTGYSQYDGPFVYVAPLYSDNPAAQRHTMDVAHGNMKFRFDDTTAKRPVSGELRILQASSFPENTAAMSPTALKDLEVFARP